jgi:hypothetical protein
VAYSDEYKRTTRGRAVSLIGNAKRRSKERNVELEIGADWVEQQLIKGNCQITGIPFNLEPTPKHLTRRWDAPSLDRINKHLPYNETNTRVVLWAVNCALSEYGTEIMLPIFKAMINGIENAKKKPTPPVSTGNNREGEVSSEHGLVSASRSGEDYYDLDHYCRTVRGDDADYRTQTRGGDGVGYGNEKVGTPQRLKDSKDTGDTDAKVERFKQQIADLYSEFREFDLALGTECSKIQQSNNR